MKHVEQLICRDHALSNLDDQLNTLYSRVTKESLDPKTLQLQQKKWLLERNHCKTIHCVTKIYLSRIKELEQLKAIPTVPGNYPVWINPLLMKKRLYLSHDGNKKTIISDCAAFDKLKRLEQITLVPLDKQKKPISQSNYIEYQQMEYTCKALGILKKAKAAKYSADRDFSLHLKALNYLPTQLLSYSNPAMPCERLCNEYALYLKNIPFSKKHSFYLLYYKNRIALEKAVPQGDRFNKPYDIQQISPEHIVLTQYDNYIHNYGIRKVGHIIDIQVLGRGDILHTGWDSLLLQVTRQNIPAGNLDYPSTHLFLLSRKSKNVIFTLINPESYLCNEQRKKYCPFLF